MLGWIADRAVRYRTLVLGLALLLAYFGYDRLQRMPLDVLPELNPPIVEVQTEAQGLSANEVEMMVSFGVEELLAGLPWVRSLKSTSVAGLSTVRLEFEPSTDLMRARQLVQERLTTSFLLPNVAKPPVMQQPISSVNRVMMIALTAKDIDPIKLSTITQWTVKPRLLGVPGVANVAIWGERRRQIQVQIDPEKLRANDVKQHQVIASAGDALWTSSLSFLKSSVPGTGGWIETPNQRLEIRHVLPMSSAEDIAKIGIDGTKLKLGDVASVVEGHPPMIGDAVGHGRNGLLLVVEKFPGANTLEVTRAVEAALSELSAGLKGIDVDAAAFRPATFVEWAMANTGQAAVGALALALLGILIAMLQWRAPVIALAGLTLSLLGAVVVLHGLGIGLNMLTIAGLGAALACLVDDVVLAAARLDAAPDEAQSAAPRAQSGAAGERQPLITASLIGAVIATPALFVSGSLGAMTRQAVIAWLLAIAASALVALTVAPALAALLSGARTGTDATAPSLAGRIARTMRAAGARPAVGVGMGGALALALAVASAMLLPRFDGSAGMMPSFRERDLVIQLEGPGGAALGEMTRQVGQLQSELRTIPGVRSAHGHVGRSISGDQIVNVNSGRIWVSIASTADHGETVARIRKALERHPELDRRLHTYIGSRIGAELGAERDVRVRVYGHQIEELRRLAGQVKDVVARIDGLGPVHIEDRVDEDHLQVTVDVEAAGRHGLKPGDVRRAASTVFAGLEVGRIFERQKVFEVVVWSTPESRRDVDSVASALIELPGGGHVRLGEVAKVAMKPGPSVVRREGVSLYLDVVADTGGLGRAAAADRISRALQPMQFPLGYWPIVSAGEPGRQPAAADMRPGVAAAIALLITLLLLQSALGGWPLTLAAAALILLSVSGGLAVAALAGLPLGVATLLGLLGAIALAARQVLLSLSEDDGNAATGAASAVASTLTSALALLPALWLAAQPGLELLAPMALVMLGALASTALAVLLVAPTVRAWLVARSEMPAPSLMKGAVS